MSENLYEMSFAKDNIVEEMKVTSALKYRTIYLWETIEEDSIFKLNFYLDRIKRLDKKHNKKEPITIIISSFGGTILEAMSSISRIEQMQEDGYIIKTIVDAKSMSCGSLISQCGSKGYRYANRYSTLLYHQIHGGSIGTHSEMDIAQEETSRQWELIKMITMKHTKITDEWLENIRYRNRDVYLSPEQALDLGVIDHIL